MEVATQIVFKTAQPTRHIDALRPHPDNPREEIDRDDPKIIEMSHSIETHGIIEPLVITPDGMLIAGHRRRVAARVAAERSNRPDLLQVPVTIREVAPEAALELMLQENMQRESLTPLEEARAMKAIMDRKGLTMMDMARLVAVPVATCSQRLAILKCEPEVQRLYAKNELPLNAASLLARVDLAEKQTTYAGMLARRTITLQQLKEAVDEDPHARRAHEKKPAKPRAEQVHHERDNAPRVITRADADAALVKIPTKKITMHTFRAVFESVCCSCGMKNQADICVNCPLPRLVLAVAGRSGN